MVRVAILKRQLAIFYVLENMKRQYRHAIVMLRPVVLENGNEMKNRVKCALHIKQFEQDA